MGRRSSVRDLPDSLRKELDRLIREGHTLNAITDHMKQLDPAQAPSRSAVGRYRQQAERQMERYRQAQETAKTWVDKLTNDPRGDVGRLLPQMLHGIAFSALSNMDPEGGAKPNEIATMAKAIKETSLAEKIRLDLEKRIREQLQEENKKKLDSLSSVRGGLDPGTLDEVRSILGIG